MIRVWKIAPVVLQLISNLQSNYLKIFKMAECSEIDRRGSIRDAVLTMPTFGKVENCVQTVPFLKLKCQRHQLECWKQEFLPEPTVLIPGRPLPVPTWCLVRSRAQWVLLQGWRWTSCPTFHEGPSSLPQALLYKGIFNPPLKTVNSHGRQEPGQPPKAEATQAGKPDLSPWRLLLPVPSWRDWLVKQQTSRPAGCSGPRCWGGRWLSACLAAATIWTSCSDTPTAGKGLLLQRETMLQEEIV